MTNMRRGFTMIELIFVIVIIGILAAVAIPKLAANRNDANAAVIASMAATCLNEVGGTYIKTSSFPADIAAHSPSCKEAITNSACYTFSGADATGYLTVTGVPGDNDTVCDKAVAITDKHGITEGAAAVVHKL